MINHIVSSFVGFHNIISSYNSRNYIFRGVEKKEYKLIPKIGRVQNHLYADIYNYESTLMNQFKKLSVPYLKSTPQNEWEWLAIAQHHGLPTRLLDWTRNPMVAAYFAVANENVDLCDSVIYVIDSTTLNSNIEFGFEPYDDSANDEVQLFEPNHITSRIIAQNGVFTVHNNMELPLEKNSTCTIDKIIIKNKFRSELKKILDIYGVNKATLFPGLDGITNYLEWFTTK